MLFWQLLQLLWFHDWSFERFFGTSFVLPETTPNPKPRCLPGVEVFGFRVCGLRVQDLGMGVRVVVAVVVREGTAKGPL